MCRSKLASEPSFPRFVLSARRLISDKASLKRLLQALLALHGTWDLAASASPDRFASVCHGERGFPDIRQKQEVAALAPTPWDPAASASLDWLPIRVSGFSRLGAINKSGHVATRGLMHLACPRPLEVRLRDGMPMSADAVL